MRKYLLFFLTIAGLLFITGCNEGYTASEGATLKQYLTPEGLQKLTINPDPNIWIIDVRSKKMFIKGHIPSARSFPSSTVMDRLSELPKDKYLIVYCETGGRAQAVIKKLAKNGYTRMMNWGGYTRWKWELKQGE